MAIDFNKGFVAFPRGLIGWEWYDDANTSRVFFHLMLTANWETKKWHGTVIEPGGQVTSIGHLAKATGLSQRSVRTALDHLAKTDYLTVKTTNKFSVITINNWDELTGNDRLASKRSANDQTRIKPKASEGDKQNDKQNDKQKIAKSDDDSSEFCRFEESPTSKTTSKTTNNRQTTDKQPTTTKQLKQLKQSKQSSSSSSPYADGRDVQDGETTTATTHSPEEFWIQNGLGQAVTPTLQERLSEYRRQGVEETLIVQAMREAAEHNANAPLPYVRKVLDQAVAAGELTLDAWQARHLRYRPQRKADRPEPSGNDFLRNAANRPRRLKRPK